MEFQRIVPALAPEERVARLQAQLERERGARLEAERIAERGLRDLYESQTWLRLQQRITVVANSASDIEEAFRTALGELSEQMGWEVANAYLIDRYSGHARACNVWYSSEPSRAFAFIERSRTMVFGSGEGLPGRVLADGRAHWLKLEFDTPNFPRRDIALATGLQSACAFPIVIGSEIVAIFEFFASKELQIDARLLETMEQVGVQLGRVVEREQSRRALLHDAHHDSLTGLPNRLQLTKRLKSLSDGKRPPGPVVIMVLDLDGLKTINDLYGHYEGDRLIVAAARRLESSLATTAREIGATSTDAAMIARVGGDEFVLLLEGWRWARGARRLARTIHATLGEPTGDVAGPARQGLSASIGYAIRQASDSDNEQMLRDADIAMYEAKAKGRGSTVRFTARLGATFRTRREVEHELRHAIEAGQFKLHYQPIVGPDDVICGYEALLRWHHPDKGMIGPDNFIPVAEQSGLILFIGDWVLEEACRAIARLTARGAPWASRFISVNVAASQFLQSSFSDRIRQLIMKHGIAASCLRLEITESAAILDLDRTAQVLRAVREWGVQTSLDDFGTGYSSLSYLRRLPFDSIKIDKSFIHAMTDDKSRQIVSTILELARTMQLSVVAEGIEGTDQRNMLKSMGCDYQQGFLHGRPQQECDAFSAE